jgi:thymidylate synthase ThyX
MEQFTEEEQVVLSPYFTNLNKPVFALRNLPEVVKGALFARYSRSAKSLRRLFLDEFADGIASASTGGIESENAKKLFERVFVEYGDDSVAQLGGAHIAVEGISNIATKLLERGRLMSYLEQSTRYIRYDKPRDGHYLYMRPAEIHIPEMVLLYEDTMEDLFRLYSTVTDTVRSHIGGNEGDAAWKRAALAASLDAARGILPAATMSNVGVYGSGQAYEMAILRLYAHPLVEAREIAQNMLTELELVIPSFVKRVSRPDRGGVWVDYYAKRDEETSDLVDVLFGSSSQRIIQAVGNDQTGVEVKLIDFDPLGEDKILAAIAQEHSNLPHEQVWRKVNSLSNQERKHLIGSYVGERSNRRHRPSRAFEQSVYQFEIVADYGAFRDLQRHRMLTIEWQDPTVNNGYVIPDAVRDANAESSFNEAMEKVTSLHGALLRTTPDVAQYATCMAHRIRFHVTLNARELMHLVELRSAPQGHPAYRKVAQLMHQELLTTARHRLVADAIQFVDYTDDTELGRLEAERNTETRRQQLKETTDNEGDDK